MNWKYLTLTFFFFISLWCKAQTEFSTESGFYDNLLNDLKKSLYTRSDIKTVTLDGKERRMFVSWVRDHIHTMKAYKYWEQDLSGFIDFYMGRQTLKGMYFDYVMSYKNENVGQLFFTNCFDNEFYFVDVENQNFFFRMPVEADLEYLLVEGVYTYWQTSGDTAFIKKWLPTLVKGMKYEMTDPLRWSEKNLLVKRPYSIDTWDFCSQPDTMTGVPRLLYHIGNTPETPKGIMHGDNSGMFQACMQLSKLYEATRQPGKAKEWSLQGELFLQRLNSVCWNGKYYAHFITEDPYPSHIKSDPYNTIGLSNTYSMNRGTTTPEMAASIINTYREIGEKVKAESLAPWFGIYPFIEPQFGGYPVGEYMNGAILPLVGGELCKAAFQNGYEKYAVEQLHTLDLILNKNNRRLPGCVNNDGTAQKEAVPDEWGEAAFVSALVEGLAGVVDKGVGFSSVEISPRWYFADVGKTSVKIGYGSDGNQIAYDYKKSGNTITVSTSGKFNEFSFRIPFPENTTTVSAKINGKKVPVKTETINQSKYASVRGDGADNKLVFNFK